MWLHLAALLTTLGGLTALTFWLRRRAEAHGGSIQILAGRRLDAHHAVWIIEVEGRRLLLGGGRERLSLLKELGE